MSITEKLKLRLCEEIKFDSDGYSAMCRVIDEFAEALKPSHNTGSPKLLTRTEFAVWVAQIGIPSPYQVYDYLDRQLRASGADVVVNLGRAIL